MDVRNDRLTNGCKSCLEGRFHLKGGAMDSTSGGNLRKVFGSRKIYFGIFFSSILGQ